MGMALARGADGDVESALTLLRAALNDAEQAYGGHNEHVIALRGNVGACLALLGRADEAAAVFGRAAEDAAAFLGPRHPQTVELHEDVANVHDAERFAIAGAPMPA
jgi:tetratricopeptide (TPR) repeat protein